MLLPLQSCDPTARLHFCALSQSMVTDVITELVFFQTNGIATYLMPGVHN